MSEQTINQRILQLENKVAILTQLASISVSLNSRVELHPLLKHIMDVAVRVVDCEAASVLLWNEKREELIFEASTTINISDNSLIGTAVPMDSIAGSIFRSKRAQQVNNAAERADHYGKIDEEINFETRNLLGVPLTYKDRVIGVLQAINKRDTPWTQDDRNYLSIIAAQAAVAIEGAKLVTQLKDANDELSQLDELKNDFISIASHELRTPLGVIMGYAAFLQEEESKTAQDNAGKVLESAVKLRKIIDGMVNLSYLKQNRDDLHLEETTVNTLLQTTFQEARALKDADEHEFKVQLLFEDMPITLDMTNMTMALSNILQNAFNFTTSGGQVTLTAEI
ncbi:MAG: GAF domain-containing protein, partial [Bacteroidota bacterium]